MEVGARLIITSKKSGLCKVRASKETESDGLSLGLTPVLGPQRFGQQTCSRGKPGTGPQVLVQFVATSIAENTQDSRVCLVL
jgi:transcription termination factor Rho